MRIPHTWKISISFSTNFNKNFACSIYSVTQLWLIWKSSIKIKSSLKTNKCPAKLSPRIICQVSPFLTKMSKNCCTHQAWTVPFTWTFTGNFGDGAKSYPTPKNVLVFRMRKMSLNRFKSFAIKSFISSPSNRNFQSPCATFICNCSHFCCIIF